MKTIEEQLALLDETVKFFTENARCKSGIDGRCVYYRDNHPGCAIGRKIESVELRKALDMYTSYDGGSGVNNLIVFSHLPADLQTYGQDFLTELQVFHDCDHFWRHGDKTANALTFDGVKKLEKIRATVQSGGYQR